MTRNHWKYHVNGLEKARNRLQSQHFTSFHHEKGIEMPETSGKSTRTPPPRWPAGSAPALPRGAVLTAAPPSVSELQRLRNHRKTSKKRLEDAQNPMKTPINAYIMPIKAYNYLKAYNILSYPYNALGAEGRVLSTWPGPSAAASSLPVLRCASAPPSPRAAPDCFPAPRARCGC